MRKLIIAFGAVRQRENERPVLSEGADRGTCAQQQAAPPASGPGEASRTRRPSLELQPETQEEPVWSERVARPA